MGRPFKDYVHVDDWEEINLQLKLTSSNKPKLFFRMKTALTPRGGRSRKLTTAVCQVGGNKKYSGKLIIFFFYIITETFLHET